MASNRDHNSTRRPQREQKRAKFGAGKGEKTERNFGRSGGGEPGGGRWSGERVVRRRVRRRGVQEREVPGEGGPRRTQLNLTELNHNLNLNHTLNLNHNRNLLPLTSYLLPLTSYLLPLTSYLLPLTSTVTHNLNRDTPPQP